MKTFLSYLNKFESYFAALAVLALTGLVVTDIFSRELLNTSLVWAQKAAVYLMIWAGFIGSSMASTTGAHLRPEIGDKAWPLKFHPLYHRLRYLVTGIFCMFAFYYGLKYMNESIELGEENPVLRMPLWIIQIIIPITFFLNGFKSLVYFIFPDTMPPVTKQEH